MQSFVWCSLILSILFNYRMKILEFIMKLKIDTRDKIVKENCIFVWIKYQMYTRF